MRKLLFLLPGTTQQFFAGGLTAELKTLKLAQQICDADIVTYRQVEKDRLFLDQVLADQRYEDCIFVISWGFDVPRLIERLGDRPTIYHAHSSGYGFTLPARMPIITVSRNTMGYWGEKALGSLIYHLPNEISPAFENRQQPRDIDVLVQVRKSSEYLLRQLVPALQPQCNVVLLDSYVDDLVGLFNRTKVYLYDSAEYWGRYRLTEGFGLPPMEALACGCQVFSSVNHALADYLDPGFNCHKIAGYTTGYDTQRILQTVKNWQDDPQTSPDFFAPYRAEQLLPRLRTILQEINTFFDYQPQQQSDIPQLTRRRIAYLTLKRIAAKIRRG
ncbi:glycosyltransferase [Leptolyngbya sp. BC1307]|uniref:glycosyltransferase n=1 Tax=Leptolyngbya sp. BC1307 TaxID=2029589 RepID=UPI000EFBDA74|nr:glycosyltransferase [Leptolyngbya sp. BC1307]